MPDDVQISIRIPQSDLTYFRELQGNIEPLLRAVENEVAERSLRTIKGATPVGLTYAKRGKKKSGELKKRRGKVYKRSGALKKSWEIGRDKAGTFITTDKPYAAVLEEGGYPGTTPPRLVNQPAVGKGGIYGVRTQAFGSGIYSTQALGGMIEPFIDGKRTGSGPPLDKILQHVVNQLMKAIDRVG